MLSGMHTVADILCVGCGSIVGWRYVRFVTVIQEFNFFFFFCLYIELSCYHYGFFQETAHNKSQKYKEGKSLLERLVEMLCETILSIYNVKFFTWNTVGGFTSIYGGLNEFLLLSRDLVTKSWWKQLLGPAMKHVLVEMMKMMLSHLPLTIELYIP